MEITGTAYRAAYAVEQGLSPTTWQVPSTAPVFVENDDSTQIGTATLTVDTDGTVNADCVIGAHYARWTIIRPFLGATLDDGSPQTLLRIGIYPTSPDPDLPAYTVVAP